ncbi:MAG: F0F1 ATP synthase subunit delta [Dehalococcoidia bacterium]
MLEALARLGIHLPSLLIFAANFLVLWAVLFLVAFKPFLRKLQERAREEERRQAEMTRVANLSEEIEQVREAELAAVRKERDSILRTAKEEGEEYIRDAQRRARRAAEAQLTRARDQIRAATTRANLDLRDSFVELVLAASERALALTLNEAEHQKLIEEALQELSALKWEPPTTEPLGFAIVTTAVPLLQNQKELISDFLTRTAKKDLRIIYRVEPTVVGGIAVHTGDVLLDATIGGRLERLKHQLLSPS